MNRMPHVPHGRDDSLRALQDPSPAVAARVLAHEGAVGVIEVDILDGLPDGVDRVGGEGDLSYTPHTSVWPGRNMDDSPSERRQRKDGREGMTHEIRITPHERKGHGAREPVDVVHAAGHDHDGVGDEELARARPPQHRAPREVASRLDRDELRIRITIPRGRRRRRQ